MFPTIPRIAEAPSASAIGRLEQFLTLPVIRRGGIRWTGGAGGTPLRIELAFENPDRSPSRPATARVEAAPFGAFLPWKPLAAARVPSVPPGGRRAVTLTLAGGAFLPPLPSARIPLFPRMLSVLGIRPLGDLIPAGNSPHFVGNLNVFVDHRAPVERHLQRAIGLRPGRCNIAFFMVGDGRLDHYTFSLASAEPGWHVELAGVAWDRPIEIAFLPMMLRVVPPGRAATGSLAVWVRRHSTGQKVPVEFELDAGVTGAKCYYY